MIWDRLGRVLRRLQWELRVGDLEGVAELLLWRIWVREFPVSMKGPAINLLPHLARRIRVICLEWAAEFRHFSEIKEI